MPRKKSSQRHPPQSAPPTPKLEVEDAANLEAFVNNAKKVWRRSHIGEFAPPGRKDLAGKVLGVVSKAWDEKRLTKQSTQGEMIRLVQKALGTDAPHVDTIKKYVKLWRLVYIKTPPKLEKRDYAWIEKFDLDFLFWELQCEWELFEER